MKPLDSIIFQTASRMIMPLLAVFSVVILMRGHNDPGGGFVGGLVIASAFGMHSMAFGVAETRKLFRGIPMTTIIGTGLATSLASVMLPILLGHTTDAFRGFTLMQGVWAELDVPGLATMAGGTVVMFDIGVYITVFGVVLLMLFELEEAKP